MSFRWPNEGVLIDLDGTLLEKEPGSKLVAFTNIMDPELCVVIVVNRFKLEIKLGQQYQPTTVSYEI